MKVTLFSTQCPKCKILERRLKEMNIQFELLEGEEAVNIMLDNGFKSAPVLSANGEMMDFSKAIEWIKTKGESN